jgi:hypothetical protein
MAPSTIPLTFLFRAKMGGTPPSIFHLLFASH